MQPLLFLLFIIMPLVELFVIIQVGQVVGPLWTVLALLVFSLAGAALVKHEGLRAWTRVRTALDAGRLPAEEVTDGALVLLAGALLLTPGFVTDGFGFFLLIPPSRALVNRAIRSRVRFTVGLGPATSRRRTGTGRRRRAEPGGDDLEVDVVDVRRTEPERPEELGEGDGGGSTRP